MSKAINILLKTLVKSFYRENAGVFIFFFVVMFGAVGQLNGAAIWAYHYSLIIGMLNNKGFFLLVMMIWLLYARKCAAFTSNTLQSPEYNFLYILTRMDKRECFRLFLVVQLLLCLPVLLYSLLIIGIAIYNQWYVAGMIVLGYQLVACFGGAKFYLNRLHNSEKDFSFIPLNILLPATMARSYPGMLFRYLFTDLKMIVAGIKLFTCGILYLLALNNSGSDYDLQFPFLFFSFGLFANGIVIHRIRQFEETYLSFYRGMPVHLFTRYLQYCLIYLVYFIPEIITIALLTPIHLHYTDALVFGLCGYAILLLLNSISFISFFEMKVYLRLTLLLYSIVYVFVLAFSFHLLYVFFFAIAAALFLVCYYRYEQAD